MNRGEQGDPCGDGAYPTAEETFAAEIAASRDQWLRTVTGGLKGQPAPQGRER